MKPYKYKLSPRPPKENLNRLKVTNEGERLTGFVKGQEASELEERFARALDQQGKSYDFQVEVRTPRTVPGQENLIDFVVEDEFPTEIDGEFVHKTAAQRADDRDRDAILNDNIKNYGWKPIVRVTEMDVETQEDANRKVGEMFP